MGVSMVKKKSAKGTDIASIQVLIHIGPPKTGTSAIQNWLRNNRSYLKKLGIYYPDHLLDKNGVSSGNVRRLFYPRVPGKPLAPIADARERLIGETSTNGCDRLLLSSENFFAQLPDVMAIFPEALLIAYIRFPLDLLESRYNQSVKRGRNKEKFPAASSVPEATHLDTLAEFIGQYGRNTFLLRPFMKACFTDGDIVSDFLSAIKVKKPSGSIVDGILKTIGVGQDKASSMSSVVNTSYCFEALEFKRWLNNFDLSLWQTRIDTFLQGYRDGTFNFSLLDPDQYARIKEHFLRITREFVRRYQVINGDAFLRAIEEKKQKPFKRQVLDVNEFRCVAEAMRRHDALLVKYLAVLIESSGRRDLVNSPYAKAFGVEANRAKQHFDPIHGKVVGFHELKNRLSLPKDKGPAAVFKNLARFCEDNGELEFAYRLVKAAQSIQPNAPWVQKKLAEYKDKLENQSKLKSALKNEENDRNGKNEA